MVSGVYRSRCGRGGIRSVAGQAGRNLGAAIGVGSIVRGGSNTQWCRFTQSPRGLGPLTIPCGSGARSRLQVVVACGARSAEEEPASQCFAPSPCKGRTVGAGKLQQRAGGLSLSLPVTSAPGRWTARTPHAIRCAALQMCSQQTYAGLGGTGTARSLP